jgi:cobalt-zinc-cadmium efflux system protein
MSHTHSHSRTANNISIAFFLNFGFTIVELIGGIFTNSIAIVSDAVHDFGDSISLAMAWYFERLSSKDSAKNYTYGYKRFSLLGAIINCVVLLVGSVYILSAAVPRILAPQPTNSTGMFILAVVGIIINGIAVLRTKKGASINEKVVSLHLLEDVLGWAAVLVGAVVIHFTGWYVIDPLLSVIIAGFVIFNVIKNVQQTLPILMQGVPQGIERESIAKCLADIKNIAGIHDLHIWSLNENYNVLTLHVVVEENITMRGQSELKKHIRCLLAEQNIQHCTIEFEDSNENCIHEDCVNT